MPKQYIVWRGAPLSELLAPMLTMGVLFPFRQIASAHLGQLGRVDELLDGCVHVHHGQLGDLRVEVAPVGEGAAEEEALV